MARALSAALAVCLAATVSAAAAVLLDDFEDGEVAGWQQQGAGEYLTHYSVEAATPGCASSFCLRVTMRGAQGWCGVSAPRWRKPPVAGCRAIELDVRGRPGCQGIIVDVHQADGARWWCLWDVPADGAWTHVTASPERFIAIENPKAAAGPNLDDIAALWLSLRPTEQWQRGGGATPTWFEVDNVVLVGGPAPAASPTAPEAAPPVALAGVRALVAETSGLPLLGQDPDAPAVAEAVLRAAGATVGRLLPGHLAGLRPAPGAVLVWEGPACRDGDWGAVERYLRGGGALLWWGAGLPFSRPAAAAGRPLPQTDAAAMAMSQGAFQSMHPLEAEGPWRLTAEGRRLWPGLPADLAPGKCRFLTTDDSVRLQNHWPWVEVSPLIVLGYSGRNWISEERPFTGAVATLSRHRSGRWAGARVLLATVGRSAASPLSPRSPVFAAALTGAVRALAAPVAVDVSLATLPPRRPPVTRAGFFARPLGLLGALDFDADDWADPEVVYATRRLGMDVLVAGVPWLEQPAADGSVVDWARTDRLVRQAEAGGWAVVFDPYCFGYGRYPWACEAGGKSVRPASIHNPVFRARFRDAMAALAGRYAARLSVVAMFATPDTGTSAFYLDDSDVGREAWADFAARHGLPPALPAAPKPGELDLSPARAAYIGFWYAAYEHFMGDVIAAIRARAPDLPLLLRGPWLNVSPSFRLASTFRAVAPHCECVETGLDVESTLRGFAARYRVPVSGENGWPKERGSALRMAAATILLGGYTDLLYSFGGPLWARPGLREFEALERVWPALRGATYGPAAVGLLIPDATTWASNPPDFFSQEGRLHLEPLMERSGVPFMAVSAQWPRLDGLRVLVDDGRNDVLPAAARRAIGDWVQRGGTLVAFPWTGRCDAAGGDASLARELGVSFTPGTRRVGAGTVIVLREVPAGEAAAAWHALAASLDGAGLGPPVTVSPPVASAVFRKGSKVLLVVHNKQESLIGAFFSEHMLPAAEAALPDLRVTATAPAGCRHARELVTGRALADAGGRVAFALPRTQWRVVEFRP